MGGCLNALWLWLPVLVYRAVSAVFRTAWSLNLWILQTISGVPLYHSKPQYRLLGVFLGTVGVLLICLALLVLLTLPGSRNARYQTESSPWAFILVGLTGVALLLLCRLLVRRGSI